jgi:uncharacterized protein YcbK (DUF882 family)
MGARIASSLLVGVAVTVAGASGADAPPAAPARPAVAANYPDMVRRWHAKPARDDRQSLPQARSPLMLEMVNTSERVELFPETDRGGWTKEELDRAAYALREPRSGEQGPIDPRILDLAYRIERRFDAPVIRVISAYRAPSNGKHSNHSRGRALDMVVPGAADTEVARFARTLGFAGVGLYVKSGFVHVDTRPKSYFWIDTSSPGRPDRPYRVLPGIAEKADTQAVARGEKPPSTDCSECENAPDPL